MGPPDKVPPKQDPLTKPVTVSIKPAESPPLNINTPTSPNMMRKFNTSPSMSGKLSPNLMKPNLKSGSSSHHSPKHSPAHVSSSPKHSIPGISSPKSHGTSPKHPSTSGSGKPSMSTLKSAANSPSSKCSGESKTKSTSKDSSRDKDRKVPNTFSVSTSKSKSSVKVKPLDLNSDSLSGSQDGLPSPSGSTDLSKSSNSNQVRNRKGSLSAIVDKLKSAQHCDGVTDLSSKSTSNSGGAGSGGNRDRSGQVSSKVTEGKSAKLGENKNSEYMVKPSSDGMKITINKTRSKDSKSSSSSSSSLSRSGTGSPKTHTGLKPGVNSGPASKKPQHLSQKTSSGSNINSSTYSSIKSSSKVSSSTKLSSGGTSKTISKLTGSPKTGSSSATDLSRKDRPKLNKSSSEKSIFKESTRKSSPTPNREENDGAFKGNKMEHYTPPLIMDGLVKFDKNFQIPKLSARTAVDDKKPKLTTDNLNNINRTTVDTKLFDLVKNDLSLKYPLAIPGSKLFENAMDSKARNNVSNPMSLPSSSPIRKDDDDKKDQPQNLTQCKDDNFKINYPISVPKSFSVTPPASEPLSLSTKSVDLTSKFIAPAPKDDKKETKSLKNDNDILLDFSSGSKIDQIKNSAVGQLPFPQSPSVSVHIVKSPAPSPLIMPSPHSASPCITDDELMDEAVIGIGK